MLKRQLSILLAISCLMQDFWARAISPENIDSYAINSIVSSKIMVERVKANSAHQQVDVKPLPTSPGLVPVQPTPNPVIPMLATEDNKRIIDEKISDHTLEGYLFQGDIPIYTWNLWAYGTLNGFFDGRETDPQLYKTTRFVPQVDIIRKLFTDSPNAILCLQEVSQEGFDFITEVKNALSSMNISVEYNKQTGSESFGQLILYRNDKYKAVRPSSEKKGGRYSAGVAAPYQFKDTSNTQDDRVLKVYFQEISGERREFAVVNVHLKWYPDTSHQKTALFNGLIDNIAMYAPGAQTRRVPSIITGDFNYDIFNYHPGSSVAPKIREIKSVGQSISTSSGGQNVNITDGFIIVNP